MRLGVHLLQKPPYEVIINGCQVEEVEAFCNRAGSRDSGRSCTVDSFVHLHATSVLPNLDHL
jgi:hypothetical protein